MKNLMNTETAQPYPPWWKFPLVWMVIAGPAVVVVAGFVTLWIALHSPDLVVTPDRAKTLMPAVTGRNHAVTPQADVPAPRN